MKKIVIGCMALLLTACANQSAPKPDIHLAPTLTLGSIHIATHQPLHLIVKDMRPVRYLAVIDSGRANVDAYHASPSLQQVLEHALSQQLQSQQITLNNSSNNTLTVAINAASVHVDQSLIKYKMSTQLNMTVTVKTPNKKLVKQYSGQANKEAPLEASLKDIQTSMDSLLTSVLHDIATDRELNQFLKENL